MLTLPIKKKWYDGKPEWGAEPGKDYYILKIQALRIREPTEEEKE